MSTGPQGMTFSVPYEIAVVRPLRQTTPDERAAVLRAAHFNTELLPQELIYLDLSTDSGVSSLSTRQLAALTAASSVEPGMGLAVEGSRSFALLAEQIKRYFGFPFVVPTTQGRSAERIWIKANVKPNTIVAGNMLFPSTRAHIEMNGAKIVDVIGEAAHDLRSNDPFKGNLDVEKLAAVFRDHGAEKVSCIYVELSVNSCGGQPVSLANLRAVKALAQKHKTPVFLDGCRILENSYCIQERETEQQSRSLREIVESTCALANGCTLSALKDFLVSAGGMILTRERASYQKALMQSFLDGVQPPGSAMEMMAAAMGEIFASDSHVASRVQQVKYLWDKLHNDVPVVCPPAGHAVFVDLKDFMPQLSPDQFPAEALAAFVYLHSGIRVTKGPPLAPSQLGHGTQLLRLAVPARKYVQGHMDDIASALRYAFAHRDEIEGLKRLDDPARSKYDPAHFAPLV